MSSSDAATTIGLPRDPFELGSLEVLPPSFVDALCCGNQQAIKALPGIDPKLVVPAVSEALTRLSSDASAAGEEASPFYEYICKLVRGLNPIVSLCSVTSLANLQAAAAVVARARPRGRDWSVSVGITSRMDGGHETSVRGYITSNLGRLEVYRLVEDAPGILPALLKTIRAAADDGEDRELVSLAVASASAFAHREDCGDAIAETAESLVSKRPRLLDGPVEDADGDERSLLISFLLGALRAPDSRRSSIPWKAWHRRAMSTTSGSRSDGKDDMPDMMGLLKLVLSVGLLWGTDDAIDGSTVKSLNDFESFRGHYWGEKSWKNPDHAIIGAWGSDLCTLLAGLIKSNRERMAPSQKDIILRALEEENTKILKGSDCREALSLVGQALKVYLGDWLPIDKEAQMDDGYHPYGARPKRRTEDVTDEQMKFLRKLASMDGLMSLRGMDYELHHHGFPAKPIGTPGLRTWLSQLPTQE